MTDPLRFEIQIIFISKQQFHINEIGMSDRNYDRISQKYENILKIIKIMKNVGKPQKFIQKSKNRDIHI